MIWSLCPYNGEADILEIRLGQLDGVVDQHVICESTVTQRGDPKPLWFLRQAERWGPWADQLTHIVCDLPGRGQMGNWAREAAQRSFLRKACAPAPDDLVLISDVDEIPDPAWLDPALVADSPVRLEMAMHMYFLNWRWREVPVRSGTRAVLMRGAKLLEHPDKTLHDFVEAGWRAPEETTGWHLAYQLEPAQMRQKILGIADDWCYDDAQRPLAHFEYCRRHGLDIFMRAHRQCDWVGDECLPPYAVANRERFAHMFIERPAEAVA